MTINLQWRGAPGSGSAWHSPHAVQDATGWDAMQSTGTAWWVAQSAATQAKGACGAAAQLPARAYRAERMYCKSLKRPRQRSNERA